MLVARPRDAAPGDALDIGTRAGKLTALGLVVVLAVVSFVLRARVAGAAISIPLVAAALVPLFATGTHAQLPRSPAELAARVLGPARDMLGRLVDFAHVDVRCFARVREGTQSYDEVRLACSPADRIPGLRSIELALATLEPGAPAALPEVLVRFDDGSEAASKIAQLAPGIRVVTGRGPDEKVLRLVPARAHAVRRCAPPCTPRLRARGSPRDGSRDLRRGVLGAAEVAVPRLHGRRSARGPHASGRGCRIAAADARASRIRRGRRVRLIAPPAPWIVIQPRL